MYILRFLGFNFQLFTSSELYLCVDGVYEYEVTVFWEVWSQLRGLDVSIFSVSLFVRWLEVLRSSVHIGSNQIYFPSNFLRSTCVVWTIYTILLSDVHLVLLLWDYCASIGLHKSWREKALWILTWRHNHVIFPVSPAATLTSKWLSKNLEKLMQSSFNRDLVLKESLFH